MSRRFIVAGVLTPGLLAMQGCGNAMSPAMVTGMEWWEVCSTLLGILIGAGWVLVPRFRRRRKARFRPVSEQRPGVLPA